jgi:hypothetical protein
VTSRVEVVPDGSEPDEAASKCPVEIPPALPVLAAPPAPAEGRCVKPSRALASKLEKSVRNSWTITQEGARLDVAFDCDAMAPRIRELVIETSNGHGFTLQLDRVRPRDDGDYDVLRLEYGEEGNPYDLVTSDEWERIALVGATVRIGVLPRARFEAALKVMRAAIHLRATQSGGTGGRSFGSSSSDFHIAYRLVDADGNGKQGSWAGYRGSDEQEIWLPLELAADAYASVAGTQPFAGTLVERVPVEEDRDFFAERFAAARDRNADFGIWYVRERLLGMSRDLGDLRIASDLLDIARRNGEHSVARSQATAVDALVRITGYDPRYERGDPRSPFDAAADMVRVCG